MDEKFNFLITFLLQTSETFLMCIAQVGKYTDGGTYNGFQFLHFAGL